MVLSNHGKRMYCVEISRRHPGDLGASVVVFAKSPVEARAEVCWLYPEYVERGKLGPCIREVRHIHCDWDAGRVVIAKARIRRRLD